MAEAVEERAVDTIEVAEEERAKRQETELNAMLSA